MENYYLVDLENVKNAGLDGIDQLSPVDNVIVFYSEKADTLKIDVIQKISEGKASVTFIKSDNGTPNALDFQLITYLYYHLAENKQDNQIGQYWIISKDTGYEASIKMAKKLGIANVHRAPSILNAVHYHMKADKNNAAKAAAKASLQAESAPFTDDDAPEEEQDMPAEAYTVLNEEENVPDEKTVEESVKSPQSALHDLLSEKCNLDMDKDSLDMIEKALEGSQNKNQFYQYFRRHMGAEEGSRFYKSIRNQYAAMKEIAGN